MVMGFRSVGNFEACLPTCEEEILLEPSVQLFFFSDRTIDFAFMSFFNFQENLQLQSSSWKGSLWIHTILQLRTVSILFRSFAVESRIFSGRGIFHQ